MANRSLHRFVGLAIGAILACIAILAVAVFLAAPAKAGPLKQETDAYCLSCHSKQDLSMTLPDGETLSLYVSGDTLNHSVHGQAGIECNACHTNITTYPHPQISFKNRRELSRSYYEACQKCHPDNYTKTLDSMHQKAAAAGNLNAPICTDCHGAHDVQPPAQPRTNVPQTCGKCHTQIEEQYKASVHGKALFNENNPDVPVCTDCHGVHNIHDPRTAQFRVQTPDLCASCHANKELMSKYGLSSDVYSLYQTSWHGVDISVYKANWPTIWHSSAVCTDCHGVHTILKADDPASSVNPQNLLATCQKCHPNAGPNWTAAWTGHNRISLQRTPALFYVDQFYISFTPFILLLCIIYVALQIFHAVVVRIRRSL